MIVTTPEYKTAVNADSRTWIPKVEIYFDGPEEAPTVLGDDDIIQVSFLEELKAESNNPLGLISSNEIIITLNNTENHFTPTNTAGPYYGKLKSGLTMKVYLGLELEIAETIEVEEIPLGVFRTGLFNAPSEEATATVDGQDRMSEIGNKTVPSMKIIQNTTIANMFRALFSAIDLTEGIDYVIGDGLNYEVLIGWLPRGKVADALQYLCIAGNCTTSADRYGIIKVVTNFKEGLANFAWTDQNQIVTLANPIKEKDTYDRVIMTYHAPFISNQKTVLFKNDALNVRNGGVFIPNATFENEPVAFVSNVNLNNTKNAVLNYFEYGSNNISINISNPGEPETPSIEVLGYEVGTYQAQHRTSPSGRALTIDNFLIQSLDIATRYSNEILDLVSDPAANFILNSRGDPSMETGDLLSINSESDNVSESSLLVTRIEIVYNIRVTARVHCRKTKVPEYWTMVSPGLYIKSPRNVN